VNAGYLILHHNRFNGTLPVELRLRQLFYLDLSNNRFEGSISHIDWAQVVPTLQILHLEYNQFSGELPESFPLVGSGNMKQIFLQSNAFTGEFPSKGWSDYHLSTFCTIVRSFYFFLPFVPSLWLILRFSILTRAANVNIANNSFTNAKDMCKLGVLEGAEMVEFRADCDVCECESMCDTCRNTERDRGESRPP
jgi:hypothetical protein